MTKKSYHFEGRLDSFTRTGRGVFVRFQLNPHDIPTELAGAPTGQRFIIALSELGDMEEDHGEGDRAVQTSGILCRTKEFRRFLAPFKSIERIPRDDAEAGLALKSLTGVASRAEYRDDPKARERFYAIKAKYEKWLERAESSGDL